MVWVVVVRVFDVGRVGVWWCCCICVRMFTGVVVCVVVVVNSLKLGCGFVCCMAVMY